MTFSRITPAAQPRPSREGAARRPEWPTILLLASNYAAWVGIVAFSGQIGVWLAVPLLAISIALHSSLQHEAIHGHPFRRRGLNEWIAGVPLGLFLPYRRYRAIHLRHHACGDLTDPARDPESFYLAPQDWHRCGALARLVYRASNTLAGRMALGPAIFLVRFYPVEVRAMLAGDRATLTAWGIHAAALAPVVTAIALVGSVPPWAYAVSAYAAMSLVMVRSYAEHRADPRHGARTVIVESNGPLAWLYLHNNLHAVHHAHPRMPWYALPAHYRAHRAQVLVGNDGYVYPSYWAVARRHLWRAKEPVVHPHCAAG